MDKPIDAAKTIGKLMGGVEMNDLGLPVYLYRPDLLIAPSTGTSVVDQSTDLATLHQSAKVVVDYDEGFPTLDGRAIWLQFSFEPTPLYKCFDIYLRQCEYGARSLPSVLDDAECPPGVRLSDLKHAFKLYMWKYRVKAYDLFNVAHRQKLRDHRAVEADNDDFLRANKLLDIANLYMDNQGNELVENMSPSMLLDFIGVATKLRRLSLGMNGDGKGKSSPSTQSQSLEVVMKTIARDSEVGADALTIDNNTSKLDNILQDSDAVKMAQELIIKVNNND